MLGFDPRFYRASNPDVAGTGMGLLLHYILFGQHEHCYPTPASLRADAARVQDSGLFDVRAYVWNRGRAPLPGLSDLLLHEDHEILYQNKNMNHKYHQQ